MSNRSRSLGAPQSRRSHHEYEEAVRRQLRILGKLGQDYDEGRADAAYQMSVCLRILLDDAQLLGRVLKLNKLRLVDTADVGGLAEGGRLSLGGGLTMMQHVTGVPDSGRVLPRLGRRHGQPEIGEAAFRDWWSRDLVVAGWAVGRDFTRRYVVIEMVNTDGGAHVDQYLDRDYLGLHGPLALMTFNGRTAAGSVAEASVRQVAWELLETLSTLRPELRDQPDVHQLSVAASREFDTQDSLPDIGGDESVHISWEPLR